MSHLVELLNRKNEFLNQFNQLNNKEIHRIKMGDTSHLNKFYFSRQILLDSIDSIDKNLKSLSLKTLTSNEKKVAKKLLNKKRKLVSSILKQDMTIHSCLQDIDPFGENTNTKEVISA